MIVQREFGEKGEAFAVGYLEEKGYQILERNWRFRHAEIDLITQSQSRLIFVEVKSRSGIAYGYPQDFVSKKQQKLIALAANEYIYRKNFSGEIRFDIITILLDHFGNPRISHIEDAFWP